MKTCLSVALFALLAVPAFAQPNLPLEIPGMAVFIPWDDPGEWVYGTAVMTVNRDPRCPWCGPYSWNVELAWIQDAPFLTGHQDRVSIWYSGAGTILIGLVDGIIAVIPAYSAHAELIACNRWIDTGMLDQWSVTVKMIGDKRHFINSRD